jgi:hypothetical protein
MLALVIIGANSADAEGGAKWQVVNAKGELVEVNKGFLSPSLQLELDEKHLAMLFILVGVPAELLCTGGSFVGAKLEAEGKISSGAQIRLTGCLLAFTTPSGEVIKCSTRLGEENGVILTNPLKGLLALHEGTGALRLEAVEGSSFAIVKFEPECGVKNLGLQGALSLRDSELKSELQSHLFVQGPLTTLWVNALAESKIVIDGGLSFKLSEKHAGLKWSGTPG